MAQTSVSALKIIRDLASAKKAANSGPVIVTDRGRPGYGLLKIKDYDNLTVTHDTSLLAAMDGIPGGDFTFEPLQLIGNDLKPADLN